MNPIAEYYAYCVEHRPAGQTEAEAEALAAIELLARRGLLDIELIERVIASVNAAELDRPDGDSTIADWPRSQMTEPSW